MLRISCTPAQDEAFRTQAAPSRSPPRPPKKTARGLHDGEPPNDAGSELDLNVVVTNAKMIWSELVVLNGRGPPVKQEELEMSLDRSILALGKFAGPNKKVKKRDLKLVMDTLRSIREYRLRFPRSNAENQLLSERAEFALNELR